jgi:hypothetical protein
LQPAVSSIGTDANDLSQNNKCFVIESSHCSGPRQSRSFQLQK